jgi:GTP-binding protein LepA
MRIDNPAKLPDEAMIKEWREPIVRATIIIPAEFIGPIMSLCQERRGVYIKTEYISKTRVIIHYKMPFAEIVYDFYDKLKSITRGYGTLDYHATGYEPAELCRCASWWPGTKWTPSASSCIRRQRSLKVVRSSRR